jgi:hypothetical protein
MPTASAPSQRVGCYLLAFRFAGDVFEHTHVFG